MEKSMKRFYVVAVDEDCAYAKGFNSMFCAIGFYLKIQEGKKFDSIIIMEKNGDDLKVVIR